eukprot:gnl/Trimastix_PCT/1036.p1 GENE.gnl/Trimastix_PCT/1036~~gnl/Trimastix_PCT/1036.p1  ORF type:complete len:478 (+),score=156.86 gnl/Trimastix_PCT/1036:50-1483(+)
MSVDPAATPTPLNVNPDELQARIWAALQDHGRKIDTLLQLVSKLHESQQTALAQAQAAQAHSHSSKSSTHSQHSADRPADDLIPALQTACKHLPQNVLRYLKKFVAYVRINKIDLKPLKAGERLLQLFRVGFPSEYAAYEAAILAKIPRATPGHIAHFLVHSRLYNLFRNEYRNPTLADPGPLTSSMFDLSGPTQIQQQQVQQYRQQYMVDPTTGQPAVWPGTAGYPSNYRAVAGTSAQMASPSSYYQQQQSLYGMATPGSPSATQYSQAAPQTPQATEADARAPNGAGQPATAQRSAMTPQQQAQAAQAAQAQFHQQYLQQHLLAQQRLQPGQSSAASAAAAAALQQYVYREAAQDPTKQQAQQQAQQAAQQQAVQQHLMMQHILRQQQAAQPTGEHDPHDPHDPHAPQYAELAASQLKADEDKNAAVAAVSAVSAVAAPVEESVVAMSAPEPEAAPQHPEAPAPQPDEAPAEPRV